MLLIQGPDGVPGGRNQGGLTRGGDLGEGTAFEQVENVEEEREGSSG